MHFGQGQVPDFLPPECAELLTPSQPVDVLSLKSESCTAEESFSGLIMK